MTVPSYPRETGCSREMVSNIANSKVGREYLKRLHEQLDQVAIELCRERMERVMYAGMRKKVNF